MPITGELQRAVPLLIRQPGRVVFGPAGRVFIKLCDPVEHRLAKWSAHELQREG